MYKIKGNYIYNPVNKEFGMDRDQIIAILCQDEDGHPLLYGVMLDSEVVELDYQSFIKISQLSKDCKKLDFDEDFISLRQIQCFENAIKEKNADIPSEFAHVELLDLSFDKNDGDFWNHRIYHYIGEFFFRFYDHSNWDDREAEESFSKLLAELYPEYNEVKKKYEEEVLYNKTHAHELWRGTWIGFSDSEDISITLRKNKDNSFSLDFTETEAWMDDIMYTLKMHEDYGYNWLGELVLAEVVGIRDKSAFLNGLNDLVMDCSSNPDTNVELSQIDLDIKSIVEIVNEVTDFGVEFDELDTIYKGWKKKGSISQ